MPDIVLPSLAREMNSLRASARPWNPWPYQSEAMKNMLQKNSFGLLLDPGMGKTSTVLGTLKVLFNVGEAKRALIVAPKRAMESVWPQEVAAWEDFKDFGVVVLHGKNRTDSTLTKLRDEHKIVVINPEGIAWLAKEPGRFRKLGADVLVIDESSKWKNPTSLRFKSIKEHLPVFKRRYILTGSPRPKNYLDLWSQMYLMDCGSALGKYISHYRSMYFVETNVPGAPGARDYVLQSGADVKINAQIAPHVLRLDAQDHLELPGAPERLHRVYLPDPAQVEYDAVEEGLMSRLFTEPLQNSAAARAKCAQMANGAVYTSDAAGDRPYQVLHYAKVEALAELIEELDGRPLLVAIGYRHDVKEISRALGYEVPCIDGSTTTLQSEKYIAQWNAGELPVLLGHPASMGHGLNLQKCDARNVAYFWLPDNYDDYDQFYRRVWRQGNKAPYVMKHVFVAQNTVDVAKMAMLEKKGAGQQSFLDAMKEYGAQRGYNLEGRKKK